MGVIWGASLERRSDALLCGLIKARTDGRGDKADKSSKFRQSCCSRFTSLGIESSSTEALLCSCGTEGGMLLPFPCSRPESGSAMNHRDPTLSLCSGSEAIKKERSNLLANHRALTSSSISRFQSLLNKATCTILSPNYSRSLLIYV